MAFSTSADLEVNFGKFMVPKILHKSFCQTGASYTSADLSSASGNLDKSLGAEWARRLPKPDPGSNNSKMHIEACVSCFGTLAKRLRHKIFWNLVPNFFLQPHERHTKHIFPGSDPRRVLRRSRGVPDSSEKASPGKALVWEAEAWNSSCPRTDQSVLSSWKPLARLHVPSAR